MVARTVDGTRVFLNAERFCRQHCRRTGSAKGATTRGGPSASASRPPAGRGSSDLAGARAYLRAYAMARFFAPSHSRPACGAKHVPDEAGSDDRIRHRPAPERTIPTATRRSRHQRRRTRASPRLGSPALGSEDEHFACAIAGLPAGQPRARYEHGSQNPCAEHPIVVDRARRRTDPSLVRIPRSG